MTHRLWLRAVGAAMTIALVAGSAGGSERPAGSPAALITCSIKQTSTRNAVAYLDRISGLRLVPLWKDADHADGLDPDRLIDLTCVASTPMRALEALVQHLEPGSTWQTTESGEIEIGPRARLNEHQTVRIYDIRDLISETPDFPRCATIDLEAALHPASGAVLREEGESGLPHRQEHTDRARDLVALITSTVEPDQWLDSGGPGGSIQIYQKTLVVKAAGYIHRQLVGALDR